MISEFVPWLRPSESNLELHGYFSYTPPTYKEVCTKMNTYQGVRYVEMRRISPLR